MFRFFLRRCIPVVIILGLANASPVSLNSGEELSMPMDLSTRETNNTAGNIADNISNILETTVDDSFDPANLSFITKLAAIGDSYSAGIGAGDRLGNVFQAFDSQSDYACSRYDHAYPYLINNDPRLGDPSKRTFQFLSCSGALTQDVLKKQIPSLNSGQQAILLSIGGNDAELVDILNQCIYQWGVLNKEQVLVAKAAALTKKYQWAADYDWDKLGLGCDGQLSRTESIIASSSFSSSLDAVLKAAKAKLAPGGKIYYTGYGKFFAEDLSADCDKVTWTTWVYKLYNFFQPELYLTKANRQKMNQLVDAMNAQLAAAAKRAGSEVVFANYDSYIGEFGGRYCEAGINEATVKSNSRTGLMFYEMNTEDKLGTTPWKRTADSPLNGTFNGEIDIFAQITLLMDPNSMFAQQEGNTTLTPATNATQTGDVEHLEVSILGIPIPNVLPDGFGRVFHPQILLHSLIANLVIYEMTNVNELSKGYSAIPEVLSITACAYTPPTSTLKTSSTTATNVPGQGGLPGCAYVIASDLGSGALCSQDYCNCGGTAAPLLTTTVSGSASPGCAYTTQPKCNQCSAGASCPASTTTTSSTTKSAPPPSTTTSSTVAVNTPPPNTTCNKDSDCSKYTCSNGKEAACGQTSNGDLFTTYCEC